MSSQPTFLEMAANSVASTMCRHVWIQCECLWGLCEPEMHTTNANALVSDFIKFIKYEIATTSSRSTLQTCINCNPMPWHAATHKWSVAVATLFHISTNDTTPTLMISNSFWCFGRAWLLSMRPAIPARPAHRRNMAARVCTLFR